MEAKTDYEFGLRKIIKRKAVGPKGSGSLTEEDLQTITPALRSEEVGLVAKAVLITAVSVLERNELEEDLYRRWKSDPHLLPTRLADLFFGGEVSGFPALLHKILRGIDLDPGEASAAISYLLDDDIADYQKGVFLIGERLKRESFEENEAFLKQMRKASGFERVKTPLLIDLADPYDGFRRYPIYTPFIVALLGAMGLPCYCHGVEKVAPKYGHTIHEILRMAGKRAARPVQETVADLEHDSVRWGYVDQSVFFPSLHGLLSLREKIVKRTLLATLEKLLQPLRCIGENVLVTGFVHAHYKTELTRLLRDCKMLNAALIVKGMEGSTQADRRKAVQMALVAKGRAADGTSEPLSRLPYPTNEWNACRCLAEYTLDTGIAALKGENNNARQILVSQAGALAGGLQVMDGRKAESEARKLLDSGKAFRHWQNGMI